MARANQSEVDREVLTPLTPAEVQDQLRRILASELFQNTQRLSAFLRFIVESALRGQGAQIKEYLIGTEVFGRSHSYDPRTDPVVRVEAGRLRLKLAEYYRTLGRNDPLTIDLPKGGYVPVFLLRSPDDEIQGPNPIEERILPAGPSPWWWGAVVVIAVAAMSTYYFYSRAAPVRTASIAVLPFVNVSESPADQYLGDGVAEELTTGLAQLNGLHVVAATSAFRFRDKGEDVRRIGDQLNARAVLEGSVSRSAGKLRINAQLVSTQNGYHLWSKVYDVDAAGVFDAEDDIVRQTARTLQVSITPGRNLRPPNRETRNAEAHDLYLQGRYFWSKRDLADMERAIGLFQAAIQKDPNFALAYAGLADTYVVLGGNGQKPLSEVVPPGRAALTQAMRLDPTLAEVHATLALLNSEASGQRRGLEAELRRAVELSPGYASAHHWLGLILSGQKRFEEANAELRTAQILDPLSPIITEGVAENFYAWRRYDDALTELKEIQKMNSPMGDELLGRVYIQKKMYDDAIRHFTALSQRDRSPQPRAELAIAFAASGRTDEAKRSLAQAIAPHQGYVSPYWIATAYLWLGDPETTFQWLERAYEQKDPMLGGLMTDPMLDPIRSDPRYTEMLRKADLIQ